MKKIYIISLLFFMIDRITKLLATYLLKPIDSLDIIPNFFSFTYVNNSGAGFGILQDQSILLALVSGIVLIILNNSLKKTNNLSKLETISYGLIIGGILGNMIDRIIYKHVIDFIYFKIFNYGFPVFNIADCCLVIGVSLLVINVLRGEINDRSKK